MTRTSDDNNSHINNNNNGAHHHQHCHQFDDQHPQHAHTQHGHQHPTHICMSTNFFFLSFSFICFTTYFPFSSLTPPRMHGAKYYEDNDNMHTHNTVTNTIRTCIHGYILFPFLSFTLLLIYLPAYSYRHICTMTCVHMVAVTKTLCHDWHQFDDQHPDLHTCEVGFFSLPFHSTNYLPSRLHALPHMHDDMRTQHDHQHPMYVCLFYI